MYVDKIEIEKVKAIKAMEYIARKVNDEEVFELWLYNGVADGDIEYGDTNISESDFDMLDYYLEPNHFRTLIDAFLDLMTEAKRSGGLYIGGICND